ncbi:MAG: hypothetical protein ACRD13_03720 [Terriglobales bacterium]
MRAYFMDWGLVFNAGGWNFPDSLLRGVCSRKYVYRDVTGSRAFEPWLSRVEAFSEAKLHAVTAVIPAEWASAGELAHPDSAMLARRPALIALARQVLPKGERGNLDLADDSREVGRKAVHETQPSEGRCKEVFIKTRGVVRDFYVLD